GFAGEDDRLAVRVGDDSLLADVGLPLELGGEELGLPLALGLGRLPLDGELLEADLPARLLGEECVGGVRVVGLERLDQRGDAFRRRRRLADRGAAGGEYGDGDSEHPAVHARLKIARNSRPKKKPPGRDALAALRVAWPSVMICYAE